MPTKVVPWYPGTSYHITARGNHQNCIFRDERDFEHYLKLIEESLEHFKSEEYKILCYCLMSNHVHMLIKTKSSPPGKFIGRINGRYAMHFNKKYNYIGHLFQGRYHRFIIKNNVQMLRVSRYIHLNPVKANIVKKPDQYVWSSYKMYIGEKQEKIIQSDRILNYFNFNVKSNRHSKRKLYKTFVESQCKHSV